MLVTVFLGFTLFVCAKKGGREQKAPGYSEVDPHNWFALEF